MKTIKSIGILTYDEESQVEASDLMGRLHFSPDTIITYDSLSHPNGFTYDLAITFLHSTKYIDEFINDIIYLKKVKGVSSIIVIVNEGFSQVIEQLLKSNIKNIFHSPVDVDRLFSTITKIDKKSNRQYIRFDTTDSDSDLAQILLDNEIITTVQLHEGIQNERDTGKGLAEVLQELGYISEEDKLHYSAIVSHVPLAKAIQYASVSLETVALIPERIAKKEGCVALERDDETLTVAMEDIFNLRLLDTLRDLTDLKIIPILGKYSDIKTTVERCYRNLSSQNEVKSLIPDLDLEFVSDSVEKLDIESVAAAGAELGIVKLVNILIANAVKDRASDIHIEPMESFVNIRYRVDGDLKHIMTEPYQMHQAILTRIKILSNLDIAERRLPQDGRMVVKIGKREIDIRVSILPTVHGEKAVLRILDKDAFKKSVSNLGFTDYELKIFNEQIRKPYGMIIVTGPTGSGKSTSLYSAIQAIKDVSKNIITVEDPVEFHMEGINQINVNTKIGLTFGSSLRSILRQDPDIILIGEIRDEETADIAIKMALTGHLVFSTLHTNNAASAIARFVDIGIPPLLLGSSINLIIAQRLVRKICTHCKKPFDAPADLIKHLHLDVEKPYTFYKGEGCVSCNGTGYLGRSGIFEMIPVSRKIRKLILRNSPTIDIEDAAAKEGMKSMRQAGIEMVLSGITTVEQIIAVTNEDRWDRHSNFNDQI
jgi:type IV pilus assembly protein PilB